jgi:hypothetical protein
MEKNKKILKKVPEVKKTLKDFMADEDGFVSKENILKVGLATMAGIGMLGAMASSAAAGHTNNASKTVAGDGKSVTFTHSNHNSY